MSKQASKQASALFQFIIVGLDFSEQHLYVGKEASSSPGVV